MNRLSLVAVVALLIVAGAAAVMYPRSEQAVPAVTATPATQPDSAVRVEPEAIDNITGPQWEVDTEAPPDPSGLAKAMGVSADDLEEVDGFTLYKDRDCELRIVRYAYIKDELRPVHDCIPNSPKPKDPYASYTTETLETMAYSDAKAAYVLADRAMSKQNYARALEYGVRSAALSNEPKPMYRLMSGNPVTLNSDQAFRESLKRRYVLSGIAESLDMDSPFHDKTIQLIAGLKGEPMDVAALDNEIEAHLNTINAIRAEVGID